MAKKRNGPSLGKRLKRGAQRVVANIRRGGKKILGK